MKKFLNFIKYNNLVPITLGVIFLGGTGAYAAQNPEALYSQSQEVVSIDNTYIVGKDLLSYTPRVTIVGVTEDEANYYVVYALTTIDLDLSAWKDVTKNETMTVSKADLGLYRDLGVYVTQQLRQIVERNLAFLREVQEKERRHVSLAAVATTYGGLIGKFLDSSTEVLPGYTPVVVEPVEVYGNDNTTVGMEGTTNPARPEAAQPPTTPVQPQQPVVPPPTTPAQPQIGIQVLGSNPSAVPLGGTYVDLGAVLLDPYNTNVDIHIYMDGAEVASPSIDTSTTASYAIEYRATDLLGTTVMARRIVLVGGASDPGGEISIAGNTGLAAPAPAPEPEPAPAPEPEPTPTPTPEPEPTPQPTATSTPLEEEPLTGQATTTPPVVEPEPEPAATTTPPVEPEPTPPVPSEVEGEPAATTPPVEPEPTPESEPASADTSVPAEETTTAQ